MEFFIQTMKSYKLKLLFLDQMQVYSNIWLYIKEFATMETKDINNNIGSSMLVL